MNVDQHTALYGVIGNPVRHSLSPALHNAAFAATGLNAVYLAFEPANIEACVRGIAALGIKGASVTIPFKTAVIPYLDDLDPLAEKIGAVNTLVNSGGRLKGHNTDGLGALKALEEEIKLPGRHGFLVGAGGAARAIGWFLKETGMILSVVNRSRNRGEGLARSLGCNFIPFEDMATARGDILIHTTPCGMWPDLNPCPIPEQVLEQGMVVMDIVYDPAETPLLRAAKTRGCTTIPGARMLLYQGAEQFRLWTGIDPPLSVMEMALQKSLQEQNHGY